MYTIQSTTNFNFICKLFSNDHALTFMYTDIREAHTWTERIDAVSVAVSLGHCIVVPIHQTPSYKAAK